MILRRDFNNNDFILLISISCVLFNNLDKIVVPVDKALTSGNLNDALYTNAALILILRIGLQLNDDIKCLNILC